MESRPSQSKFSKRAQCGSSKSISASAASVTPMPGSTLMKKSQCQESWSVR